jgi:hypothetical protein
LLKKISHDGEGKIETFSRRKDKENVNAFLIKSKIKNEYL